MVADPSAPGGGHPGPADRARDELEAAEAVGAAESAAPAKTAEDAARALEWLDTTLGELRGALTACGECIDAGVLDATVVSSRMNALVMQMMAAG